MYLFVNVLNDLKSDIIYAKKKPEINKTIKNQFSTKDTCCRRYELI